jgi:hypothetical protein
MGKPKKSQDEGRSAVAALSEPSAILARSEFGSDSMNSSPGGDAERLRGAASRIGFGSSPETFEKSFGSSPEAFEEPE